MNEGTSHTKCFHVLLFSDTFVAAPFSAGGDRVRGQRWTSVISCHTFVTQIDWLYNILFQVDLVKAGLHAMFRSRVLTCLVLVHVDYSYQNCLHSVCFVHVILVHAMFVHVMVVHVMFVIVLVIHDILFS